MTELEFTVYAVPVAQPRQRHRIFRSKTGQLLSGNYTPVGDPVHFYKYMIKEAARKLMNGARMFEGPLAMILEVYLPRPKKYDTKKFPPQALWHDGHKDVDNLFKSVADALTGIVYKDDGQICNAEIRKHYHERAGIPRVYVMIWKIQ